MPPARAGHDRWLVSYADLVTLLLAFFCTLYAGSNIDAQKMAPLTSSLQDAFAIESPAAPSDGHPTPIEVVQRSLNHSNIAMTMVYAHVGDEELVAALDTLPPLWDHGSNLVAIPPSNATITRKSSA